MTEKTGKPSLLLLELIIDLFLFLICAAVCVTMLIHARSMSRESTRLTDAVYAAQTAAEEWRAGQTPAAAVDGYEIRVEERAPDSGVRSCTITVSHNGKVLYTLEEVAAP